MFASEWFEAHKREWTPNTRVDYRWQLSSHLLPFFYAHRLTQITIAEVDRYRAAKVRERTLGPTSINKTIIEGMVRVGLGLVIGIGEKFSEGSVARAVKKNRVSKNTRV